MYNLSRIVITVMLVVTACAGASAQAVYNLDWGVVAGGGDTGTSFSYDMTVTAGQPAAGLAQGTSTLNWIGFWTSEMDAPTVAPSIAGARMLADGTYVSIAGRIATSGNGDFADFFYVEESNRTSGIRIAAPPSAVSGLANGSVVNIIGTLGTSADDERELTGPMFVVVSTAQPLAPLSMSNAGVGGGDTGVPPLGQYGVWRWQAECEDNAWVSEWVRSPGLNNIGLLIQTWGKVIDAGTGYVDIDDSNGPVRVDTTTLATPPSVNDYVSVIGISSLYKTDRDHRSLVLPRGDGDVSEW